MQMNYYEVVIINDADDKKEKYLVKASRTGIAEKLIIKRLPYACEVVSVKLTKYVNSI